ncbi:hypothetical protein [Thermofilum sp.]|uniref:hypothetical protein n=1 Tax=Thermofilum sp. TaxID=1961369 RepID=UPI003180F009
MRIVVETPVKNQCVQQFIEVYRRLSPPLEIDGKNIYATWDDWDTEGQNKIQYEAEVDLANGTILMYYYDGKKKRKLCKSRISTFDTQFFQNLMYPGKKKVYLRHTKCVTDNLCLVPVHYGGYPALAVAMKDEKLVRLVPSWTIGDRVYFADTNVDLSPPPPEVEYNKEELKKAVQEVAKYGADVGVLALLPYIQMHAVKRYVPVVVGPMRTGKTNTLIYIYSAWPQPKKYVSTPSTASLRDSLVRNHVVADDVGEDPERPFNWRIVIPYFERGAISRLRVQTMHEVTYILHGALVMATNAPSDDIRSVQDRIRYIHGYKVPPSAETEPHPQFSWLTFNPFLFTALPPWLSAIDAAMALLFGEPPPPPPRHELLNEPYMAFVTQLYYKLAKLYAISDNPCGDPEKGQPPSKYFKMVGERGYIVFQLKNFENPMYRDKRVTITRSVTLRDVKTVTTSISRTSMHYSVTEAKLIIEHFNLPVEILLFEKNYYVAIPCEKLEETFIRLKTIVK